MAGEDKGLVWKVELQLENIKAYFLSVSPALARKLLLCLPLHLQNDFIRYQERPIDLQQSGKAYIIGKEIITVERALFI